MAGRRSEYTHFPSADDAVDIPQDRNGRSLMTWGQTLTLEISLVVVGIVIGALLQSTLRANSAQNTLMAAQYMKATEVSCGSSPNEAKRNGCVFDLMNYAWTPPACYSQALVNESLALESSDWKWYNNQSMGLESELPQDPSVLSRVETVWTEHAYHAAHCLYMWRSLQWVLYGNLTAVQSHFSTYRHQRHCIELMSREKTNNAKHALVHVEYVTCVKPAHRFDVSVSSEQWD